jgi:hypothetical protein
MNILKVISKKGLDRTVIAFFFLENNLFIYEFTMVHGKLPHLHELFYDYIYYDYIVA